MKKSRVVITVLVFVIVVLVVIIGYLLKKDTNNEKTLAPKESIALKRYAEELLVFFHYSYLFLVSNL